MPELAEIKLMADYINQVSQNKLFTAIQLSPAVEKRLPLALPKELTAFSIYAHSIGKELRLTLESESLTSQISISMGMSGHWSFNLKSQSVTHQHLIFSTSDGYLLSLVDPRRFARWKWFDPAVGSTRGPCPLIEKDRFIDHVLASLVKRSFARPIHLTLMDQRYFNGIGNYLRAEILFRANQDPFEPSREAILNNPKLLELCHQVPLEAYLLGGGQLKDWKNPFNTPPVSFFKWIKCYGKADRSIVDTNGRRLWYYDSQINYKK